MVRRSQCSSSCRWPSWSPIVRVELGQRRIPVQFAKRVVGRRQYGGQNTYIPLKVNQAGIVPIIFASSCCCSRCSSPTSSAAARILTPASVRWITRNINTYIVNSQNIVYMTIFALMIIAFSYFYNSIAFDPIKPGRPAAQAGWVHPRHPPRPADRALPRQGGQPHHPAGRRVRRPHRHHSRTSSRGLFDVQNFPFAGTTVLIAVGVALELMRQIDSQLMLRNYEGFLK